MLKQSVHIYPSQSQHPILSKEGEAPRLNEKRQDLFDQRWMIYHLSFDSFRIKCTIESEVAAYKEIYL